MHYYIHKTGLEIFDLCRAYGLATLLDFASPEESSTIIKDAGGFYLIEHDSTEVSQKRLLEHIGWYSLFEKSSNDRTWAGVFLTDKKNWPKKVDRVKDILTRNAEKIFIDFQNVSNFPQISSDKGETLPGPLDPSAFKGLKGRTRGDYSEGQTKVDSLNWALACLGGSISGRYKVQKAQGNKWEYFVIFPVPERIELRNFREIRESTYTKGLKYLSVQNAAAHFSVLLAEKMREMSASKSQFKDTFSGLFYFSIVQSGKQFKPSVGGNLSLYPLLEFAMSKGPAVTTVFEVWKSLFWKGSFDGCEDMGEAITEFIMHPTNESYENHVKILVRYIIDEKKKRGIKLYDGENLKEVMAYVKT